MHLFFLRKNVHFGIDLYIQIFEIKNHKIEYLQPRPEILTCKGQKIDPKNIEFGRL